MISRLLIRVIWRLWGVTYGFWVDLPRQCRQYQSPVDQALLYQRECAVSRLLEVFGVIRLADQSEYLRGIAGRP